LGTTFPTHRLLKDKSNPNHNSDHERHVKLAKNFQIPHGFLGSWKGFKQSNGIHILWRPETASSSGQTYLVAQGPALDIMLYCLYLGILKFLPRGLSIFILQ
jgi:hypothetical protein